MPTIHKLLFRSLIGLALVSLSPSASAAKEINMTAISGHPPAIAVVKLLKNFFIPEVDDEVLVAFGYGDINEPYIIGSLWNGVDLPPETNSDGKNNIRKIKSRSGHEIIFNDDDEQQQEKLVIHTRAGHKIVLDDSSGSEKIVIMDKSESNYIEIDSNQNSMKIESSMQMNIKSQDITIEAGGRMTLKSSGTLEIKGSLVQIN